MCQNVFALFFKATLKLPQHVGGTAPVIPAILYLSVCTQSAQSKNSNNVMPKEPWQHIAHCVRSPLTTRRCDFYYGVCASLSRAITSVTETDILRSAICTGAKTAREFC